MFAWRLATTETMLVIHSAADQLGQHRNRCLAGLMNPPPIDSLDECRELSSGKRE